MTDRAEAFDQDALLDRARRVDGLSDFGESSFLEPLEVLLSSLVDAPLSTLGATLLRRSLVRSLANRLRAGHWFDAHPEIADEVIEAPLVVVGMMRSGTTLAQRLLASDPRHYCTLGWEALEPAPRLGLSAQAPDPRIAEAEARDAQTRTLAPDLFAIHPTHAHEAEEEIMFLADAFMSHVPEAWCDVPVYRKWLDDQDWSPAYRHLYRMLQLLQWQKKRRGEHRERWILKTPVHLGHLDRLFASFPDAHVIHMHRDPVDTVASGASLNTTLWRMHADDVDPARVGAQWLERMAWSNGRAMAYRDAHPDRAARFTDLRFREAVADPLGAVESVYARAGVEVDEEARARMQAWLQRDADGDRPRHRFAPRDFGLSRDGIRETFAGYTARFLADGDRTAAMRTS